MKAAHQSSILQVMSVLIMVSVFSPFARGTILYVDDDATGANTGTSWADAYTCLQDALADANDSAQPVEIRVGQGVYKPDQGAIQTPANREATFQLINGVSLLGGFAGIGEADPDVRDVDLYETILSGDLAGDDVAVDDPVSLEQEPTRGDNSYHVVTANRTDQTAVLDGFTVTAGQATSSVVYSNDYYGGGMFNDHGSPVVAYCTFAYNCASSGGAVYNWDSSPTSLESSPSFVGCTFHANSAGYGGAMYNSVRNNPKITDCVFRKNHARMGGAISNGNCSTELTNCVFSGNSATEGGAMTNYSGSSAVIRDCIFTDNSASHLAGALTNDCESTTTITHCMFRHNSARYAGAVANFDGSRPTLEDCTFQANTAQDRGGAMSNGTGATVLIVNCVFAANTAGKVGGAIRNCSQWGMTTTVALRGCTLVANAAPQGSSIACHSAAQIHEQSDVVLTDSILRDPGDGVWNDDGSTITISYSNIENGPSGVHDPCEAVIWGPGNIDADPLFATPGYWAHAEDPNIAVEPNDPNAVWVGGDYHLMSEAGRWSPASESWIVDDVTSPCIDMGDPNSPVGHEPYPNGAIINMGAYGGTSEASKSPSGLHSRDSGGSDTPYDSNRIATTGGLNDISRRQEDIDRRFVLTNDLPLSDYKDSQFGGLWGHPLL